MCDRCGDPTKVYSEQLAVLREFFAEKGSEATENYFWRNALEAYRWRATETTAGPFEKRWIVIGWRWFAFA